VANHEGANRLLRVIGFIQDDEKGVLALPSPDDRQSSLIAQAQNEIEAALGVLE
jgi:hypothetical protein